MADKYVLCPGGSGKKVKFCCKDLAPEIEKAMNLLEGQQRAAALQHLNRVIEKHGQQPALMDLKITALLEMQQFQEERLSCISNLRPLEIAIERTIEYCRERKVFGRPVLDNQVVHFRLAELQTEIEATRALFYRAAEAYIDGEDVTQLASMAKLKIGRLCREVSDACLQYWGGQGFMWDNPISRLYRDGRLVSIGGGTDEIMLNIISKGMGTLPR